MGVMAKVVAVGGAGSGGDGDDSSIGSCCCSGKISRNKRSGTGGLRASCQNLTSLLLQGFITFVMCVNHLSLGMLLVLSHMDPKAKMSGRAFLAAAVRSKIQPLSLLHLHYLESITVM